MQIDENSQTMLNRIDPLFGRLSFGRGKILRFPGSFEQIFKSQPDRRVDERKLWFVQQRAMAGGWEGWAYVVLQICAIAGIAIAFLRPWQ